MDRIVQKLNSPLCKRKSLSEKPRNFGVPIKALIYKKSILIPKIVTNICEFLLSFGMKTEGIFRVNGSAKAIANLRTQFDITAADNLDGSSQNDIHAICGVFKLFLREIPEGIIPDSATKRIVKIMEQLKNEKPQCVLKLRNVIASLPEENHNLLMYICQFLRILVANESSTKMSASNLGIVFGPCLFKCGLGMQGLRQQSLSNLATTYFITHFDVIFSDEVPGVESIDGSQAHLISATSLNSLLQRQKKRRLPPRRSVIGMEMPRSRPITPRGDVLSPVVSPVLGAGVSAHSTSSLSLSPVHKWMYSDNEDMDLGSHGVLARELATIMTSISIPSVASAEKFSPSNPPICTRPVAERPNATPPPPQSLAGVDLAKSLPSLIHPSEACGAWRGRRRRSPGNAADEDAEEAMEEEEESSESSANSLLEGPLDTSGYLHKHFHHDALPHLLTESNTETTQTLTLDDDFDSVCQSCLSSSVVNAACLRHHRALSTSDTEVDDAVDDNDDDFTLPVISQHTPSACASQVAKATAALSNATALASPTHFFPRARYRSPPVVLSSHKQIRDNSEHNYFCYHPVDLLHEVLNYADEPIDVVPPCSDRAHVPSPVEACATVVVGTRFDVLDRTTQAAPPKVLIAIPVCSDMPKPSHVFTWPRKRNILSKLQNRRSLDVYIPLPCKEDTLVAPAKVRLLEKPPMDISLPFDSTDMDASAFLKILQAVLESRREECSRPTEIEQMSPAELAQEKLDLQKCLLYFEKEKGRPCDVITKKVMKPLYDRYRAVRRLVRLASNSAVRDARPRAATATVSRSKATSAELPTAVATSSVEVSYQPVLVEVAAGDAGTCDPISIGELEPQKTSDASVPSTHTDTEQTASTTGHATSSVFLDWDISLAEFTQTAQELTPSELSTGRAEVLSAKHKLQRVLHDFEKGIQEATNRPPSKRDRDELRGEYNRYRDFKQRLYIIDRLLEAPQTPLEVLLAAAQSVGRAHRRRRHDEQPVGLCHGSRVPVLHSPDSTSCT